MLECQPPVKPGPVEGNLHSERLGELIYAEDIIETKGDIHHQILVVHAHLGSCSREQAPKKTTK